MSENTQRIGGRERENTESDEENTESEGGNTERGGENMIMVIEAENADRERQRKLRDIEGIKVWMNRKSEYLKRRKTGKNKEEEEEREREREERERERREGEREVGQWINTERNKWENRMEEWLCDAAMRGDVKSLNEIIKIDDYILDKVLMGTFKGKNPLHVAVSTGQKEFVLELLEKKEDLVQALDMELGTALHIASSKGYLEIVKVLVEVSPGMCVTRDRQGNNPLHIAAMQGKVEVLEVLLQASPHAARLKVDCDDSILHLCVNYNQLESLKLLLKMVGDQKFVNSTDTNGNNILHLAVFGKRVEIIKYVLGESKIDVNARNGCEWTALDILDRVKKKEDRKGEYDNIERILDEYGAKRRKKLFLPFEASEPKWQKKKKETLMIVSSLMATIAFQVGVNPPGGVWVDNGPDRVAGKAITAYNYPNAYRYFMYCNTIGFLLSLTTILELIVALPSKHKSLKFIRSMISWMTIMATAFAYTFSVIVISPTENYANHAILVMVIVWAAVITYFRLFEGKMMEVLGLAGLDDFVELLVSLVAFLPVCIVGLICKRRRRNKANKATDETTGAEMPKEVV